MDDIQLTNAGFVFGRENFTLNYDVRTESDRLTANVIRFFPIDDELAKILEDFYHFSAHSGLYVKNHRTLFSVIDSSSTIRILSFYDLQRRSLWPLTISVYSGPMVILSREIGIQRKRNYYHKCLNYDMKMAIQRETLLLVGELLSCKFQGKLLARIPNPCERPVIVFNGIFLDLDRAFISNEERLINLENGEVHEDFYKEDLE